MALLALSAYLALSSYAVLRNLWADYQDSPDSTYLMYGVPLLIAACLACWGGSRLLRR